MSRLLIVNVNFSKIPPVRFFFEMEFFGGSGVFATWNWTDAIFFFEKKLQKEIIFNSVQANKEFILMAGLSFISSR